MQKNKVIYFNDFVIISQCLSATISNQQQHPLKNKLIFVHTQLFYPFNQITILIQFSKVVQKSSLLIATWLSANHS